MTRVRRNDAPADGHSLGFACDDRSRRRGRARLQRMLAPPGVRFRQPKDVEARSFASLRHLHRLVERLHAQLQNADSEWKAHCSICSTSGSLTSRRGPLFPLLPNQFHVRIVGSKAFVLIQAPRTGLGACMSTKAFEPTIRTWN